MRKTISLKIDVTKIDKERLYQGKKGVYLDAILMFDTEKDKYDNNGMIVQSVSKEEREAGTQGNILGNAKDLTRDEPVPVVNEPDNDDELPF